MGLDPDFIKKIQEKKAKREALEKKYAGQPARRSSSGSRSGGARKTGPVYRSVSMLSGDETIITGEDAKARAKKAEYKG
jgi:hypothetical protein